MQSTLASNMSLISVLTICALVVMASATDQRYFELEKAPEYFAQFMKDYNRTYKDDADKAVHYAAFVESLKQINESNAKSPHALFGINKFADYTPEESKNLFGFRPQNN